MIIVIPTYDRPQLLQECTLAYLDQCGVADDIIHIFVARDPEQSRMYGDVATQCGRGYHWHWDGPVGLHNMRNHITNSFSEGTEILCMDDDIKSLIFMTENTEIKDRQSSKRYELHRLNGGEFWSWIETAFTTLHMSHTKIFGIYPVRNGFFMKDLPYVTEDLRFCVGTCWGYINDHRIQVTIEEKEDYERTLLCWELFGSVLRYNHVAAVTSYYTTPGGMQSRQNDRQEASKESCQYLVTRFPGLCKHGRRKKTTGIYEISLERSKRSSVSRN
jgi:hypothetical protein